jgi:hypothetical protein
MPDPASEPAPIRWILLATLVGAALRATGLDARPLWMDEALQVQVSHSADLLEAIRTQDLHPPLLTLLLSVVPASAPDALHRLPSWLASVACIPLAGWAAWRWSGADAARWAVWLAALLPTWVLYGAEARPYALGLATTLAVLGAAAAPTVPLLTVAVALAITTQYGTWPVAACALIVAARARALPTAVATLVATVVGAVLALTILVPQQHHQAAGLSTGYLAPWFWNTDDVLWFTLTRTCELLGYLVTGTTGALGFLIGSLLANLIFCVRMDRLTALALAPLMLFWLLAGLGLHPYGGLRQLLVLSPAFLLWTSASLGPATPVRLPILAIPLLVLWARHPGLPVEDMPCVVAAMDEAPRLADAGARFAVAHYGGEPDNTWPWKRDQALIDATWEERPRERTWLLLTTSRRPSINAWLDAWTEDGGRLGQEIQCTGAAAIELLPP